MGVPLLAGITGLDIRQASPFCYVWREENRESTLPPADTHGVHVACGAVFMLLAVLPCYAYGDPSGGTLFQVIMPTSAAIWGMWLIFANSLCRRAANLLRTLRRTSPDNQLAMCPVGFANHRQWKLTRVRSWQLCPK